VKKEASKEQKGGLHTCGGREEKREDKRQRNINSQENWDDAMVVRGPKPNVQAQRNQKGKPDFRENRRLGESSGIRLPRSGTKRGSPVDGLVRKKGAGPKGGTASRWKERCRRKRKGRPGQRSSQIVSKARKKKQILKKKDVQGKKETSRKEVGNDWASNWG